MVDVAEPSVDARISRAMGICTPLVKRWEGLHRVVTRTPRVTVVPYLCPANYWTQGYGRIVPKDSPAIDDATAEEWLRVDLLRFYGGVLRASPVLVRFPTRAAAITSFAFNCGLPAYRSSTLRKRVDKGDWQDAFVQIQRWVNGGGRRLPGLVARRADEARLLLKED